MYKLYEDHWGIIHLLDEDSLVAWLKCYEELGDDYFWLPEEEDVPSYMKKNFNQLKQYKALADKGDAEAAKLFLMNFSEDFGDEMWMERDFVTYE